MTPSLTLGQDAMRYASMAGRLDQRLLANAKAIGFEFMSPPQQAVLTQLPNYRSDCLVQAKTGTGKTAAFLLPILHNILNTKGFAKGQVSALIMSPTRELAEQIRKECDALTAKAVECHVAFGGTAKASNLNRFMQGSPTVLVATPGRLKDYLSEERVRQKFKNLQTLVLDEADTMLESGFYHDIKDILKLLPPKRSGWQGMCFSATIQQKTREVVECVLSPGYVSLSTIDKSEPPTVEKVPQTHIIIPSIADSFKVMKALLDRESTTPSKIIVFGPTANMVALYHELFSKSLASLPVFEMHSRLNQNKRTKITQEFKNAKSGIMFASDVIGRGMDFPNVDLVIQASLPPDADQYVHRVGRTGRADATGRAIIMLTQAETFFLRKFNKLPIQPHPDTSAILTEAETVAPKVNRAMDSVDNVTKNKAYSASLGNLATSPWLKQMSMDKIGLVMMLNDFALAAMRCKEVPALEKKTIGKMGLKNVPGLRISAGENASAGRMQNGGSRKRTHAQSSR